MPITYTQLIESLKTKHYGDWEVVPTTHSNDREGRTHHMSDADWDKFHHRTIAEIEKRTQKPYKNGEYMVHSKSLGDPKNPGHKVVINLHRKPGETSGQIRHITRLEPHMVPKVGTQTIRVESVEIPTIEIE